MKMQNLHKFVPSSVASKQAPPFMPHMSVVVNGGRLCLVLADGDRSHKIMWCGISEPSSCPLPVLLRLASLLASLLPPSSSSSPLLWFFLVFAGARLGARGGSCGQPELIGATQARCLGTYLFSSLSRSALSGRSRRFRQRNFFARLSVVSVVVSVLLFNSFACD